MLLNVVVLDELAALMVFKLGSSMSPNSLTIEFVSHGDSSDGACEENVGCCGFFTELFWNTLQTTHSSCKIKYMQNHTHQLQ